MEEHVREQVKNAMEVEFRFREMLDELYPVEILGMKYNTAIVLNKVDPIAYREYLLNYAHALAEDGDIDEDVINYI